MSVQYLHDGKVIWAPAEHTDAVFRSLVQTFERRHDLVAGVTWADATVTIDPAALQPFAQSVVDEWDTVGSTAYHQLVDGFVAAIQVLAERCGLELEVGDEAYALATSMRHNM